MKRTRPDLHRKLALEAPTRVPDGAGGSTQTWAVIGTHWADITPAGTGREAGPVSRQHMKVTIRATPHGAPSRPMAGMRFRDGARVYDIAAVTESDPSRRYLICFVVEEVGL